MRRWLLTSTRRRLQFGAALLALAAPVRAELTRAVEVRSLSYDAAKAGPQARLRGTVTFIEGPGAVFIQDETAGTFFRPAQLDKLRPGDVVEVTGPAQPGNYLPGIGLATYRILGHGPLPPAVSVGYDDLQSGRYHYQRVAVEGIARSVTPFGEGRSVLRIDVSSRIVEAWVDAGIEDENAIIDSRVRVEGLAAGGINRRRQLVQPYLRTRDSSEITILEPAVPEARVPYVAAADLLTFRVAGQRNHRIRIDGVVTACPSKVQVFVRSGPTAFSLRFTSPTQVEIGDQITALGFAEMGRFSASVVDAQLLERKPGPPPEPAETDIPAVLAGTRDGDLVAVTATLTDAFRTDQGVALSLQRNGKNLQAYGPPMSADLPIGGVVRVTGVCQVESSTSVVLSSRAERVSLHLRSPTDIAVLEAPPWWNARRLATVLFALLVATLLAGLWIAILRRQVRRQTAALRQKIESEAALEERQRIAREFHDSLEQDLTGLALRLEAAATRPLDEKGRQIMEVSCALLSRIQAETRNIVSDLRSPAETDGDLASSLAMIAAVADNPGTTRVQVAIRDSLPTLPATTLHHLRMIARESVNNAIKHARASLIRIEVSVRDGIIRLLIRDDGRGLDTPDMVAKPGHFGCVGIRERARRLGAQVKWISSPGQGTSVEVELPVPRVAPAVADRPSAPVVPVAPPSVAVR